MNIREYFVPAILSFAISAISGPIWIPFLQRVKAGQTVRNDGPKSHLEKNGTPTMGGFIFLTAFAVTCLIYIINGKYIHSILPVMVATLGFAAIGFIDDFIKVVLKRSMGLKAWQKFLLQALVGIVVLYYIQKIANLALVMKIPFSSHTLDFGIFTYPVYLFILIGTVNGSNFTDGLDGLASSVTSVIATFFLIIAMLLGSSGYVCDAAMLGGLLGFLLYNSHKASVFMGDTGSLALGAYVATTAFMYQMPLFIIFVAFIYLAEVCSVIIQVGYFKITKGKRIFRMAPIHHHFELGGWKETKVVAVFTIVTIALCVVAAFGI